MKIIITEEQKKNLFKVRNLDRWDKWNSKQPIVDGVKINQYNEDGKKIGLWLENVDSDNNFEQFKIDVENTKPIFESIFNYLDVVKVDGRINFMLNSEIILQKQKSNSLWCRYDKLWLPLQISIKNYSDYRIQNLIKFWMEKNYKLGKLKPLECYKRNFYE